MMVIPQIIDASVPIGKEAFVFFVEEDNPIDNLTSDQIRQIYSGEITNNWSLIFIIKLSSGAVTTK